jgi:parallel beta-helix repeat protein
VPLKELSNHSSDHGGRLCNRVENSSAEELMKKCTVLSTLLLAAACQTPFDGSSDPGSTAALATPIRVQFENFNEGGEGVGYHDLDASNNGGQLRAADGVDIEKRANPDGYNIGWVQQSEWLKFNVSIASAGDYDLNVALTSGQDANMTFTVDVDNGAQSFNFNVGAGQGYDAAYQSLRAGALRLSAGDHTLKITVANGSWGTNLDYFELVQTATPVAPVRVQAEDFDQGGEGVGYHDLDATNNGGLYRTSEGVDIEQRGNPDGYNVGWVQLDEWLKYTVKVPAEKNYDLNVRLSSDTSSMAFTIDVDNGAKTLNFEVPAGQGYDTFVTLTAGQLQLTAGEHVLKFTVIRGNYAVNLDYVELVEAAVTPPPPPPETTGELFYVGPNGNDNNPGTQASPWRSLQKAISTLNGGQTALVANGTYTGFFTEGRNGQAGKPIILQAVEQGGAKVDVPVGGQGASLKKSSYISIIGFDFSYRAGDLTDAQRRSGDQYENGILMENAHHMVIRNNTVRDFPGGGIGAVRSDYLLFEGNTLAGNAFWSGYASSAISTYQSVDFDSNPGYHIVIRGNYAYNNENKVPFSKAGSNQITDGNCIILDDHRNTQSFLPGPRQPPYKASTLVENNVCAGNGGRGVHVFSSDNVMARNNTLYYNNKTSAIEGELTAGDANNVQFLNNIVYTGRRGSGTGNISNVTFERNLYFGTDNLPNKSGSDITGQNPSLVNPVVGGNVNGFALNAGSPAIGRASQAPATDFSGAARDGSPDLGAWERR